ncbi:MAG: hypothetical protein HZA31_07805 [Opitutae bacterium]|nr:hypothetical protein [Opitutae bacterium]
MISPLHTSGSGNLYDAPATGMRRGAAQLQQAADTSAQGEVAPSTVSLQIQAEILVQANVAAARAVDQIVGSLLQQKA